MLTDEAGAARPAIRDSGIPVLVHEDPRGVLGAVAAWIYGEPSLRLAVLGVTGTSGKTTTTYMIDAGLRAAGLRTGLVGTVETRIAGERLASAFTTPEAPDLQALFAVMVERGVTHVPMEVSSHALALGRANGTRFAVGAFTNLSQDHLDFHPDMEDYFQAKALLFDGRSTTEVVCVDGEWGKRLVTPHTVTVATEGEADWTATGISTSRAGEQSFTMRGPNGLELAVTLPIPGSFNVANALLAAACLHGAGVATADIVAGLSTVEVPGRMERVALGQDFTAVVDYAHKPAAVALALDAMRGRTDGRLIVVLGCGGDRDQAKRPMMGEAAARRSDLLIVTDDNPRSEDPAAIRAAMREGADRRPARRARRDRRDRRPARGDHRGRGRAPAGRRRRHRRQGPRDRPGDRRRRAPVLRPRRAARGDLGPAREGVRMIPLTLAEIADGDRRQAAQRATRRRSSPAASSSTPARPAPAGCSSRCPASAWTATTSPRRPSSRARSACSPPGRSPRPRSSCRR